MLQLTFPKVVFIWVETSFIAIFPSKIIPTFLLIVNSKPEIIRVGDNDKEVKYSLLVLNLKQTYTYGTTFFYFFRRYKLFRNRMVRNMARILTQQQSLSFRLIFHIAERRVKLLFICINVKCV